MASNGLPSIEKLRGRDNWDAWRFAVQTYLEHEDLWSCVEDDEGADVKTIAKTTTTAKECWDKLQEAFQDNGLSQRVGLLKKLITTKMDECASVEQYVNEVITTANKLNSVGLQVTDEWVGTLLLAGLSDHYKPMIMGIESCGLPITGDSIKTKILQDVKSCDESDTVAFYGRGLS